MKKNWRNIKYALTFLFVTLVTLTACNENKSEDNVQTAHSGMDMSGMEHSMSDTMNMNNTMQEPVNDKTQSVTVIPMRKSLSVSINATGYITYNQNNLTNISARISGRVEKLYVKSKYQYVTKGQVLFDLYSPELVNEQEQLLYYITQDASNNNLINASKEKLMLLGFNQSLIDEIVKRKKSMREIPVLSNVDGYLIDNTEGSLSMQSSTGNIANAGMSSMTSQNNQNISTNSGIELKQGGYVSKGQTIFKIANIRSVWAEVKVPAAYLPFFKSGQQLQLNVNQQNIDGKVILIEPVYESNSPFVSVRVLCENQDEELKINQWINTTISLGSIQGLWLPVSSVINLGLQQIVYKKNKESVETVKVQTGVETNGFVQIIRGISESDEIIKDAGYLNDSESFVK